MFFHRSLNRRHLMTRHCRRVVIPRSWYVVLLSKRSKLAIWGKSYWGQSLRMILLAAAVVPRPPRTWTSSFKEPAVHTDQFLHTVVDYQLTRIDRDGWHPIQYPWQKHGDPCKSLCNQTCYGLRWSPNSVFKKILSNKFRTKRIPRKKKNLSAISPSLSSNMDRYYDTKSDQKATEN